MTSIWNMGKEDQFSANFGKRGQIVIAEHFQLWRKVTKSRFDHDLLCVLDKYKYLVQHQFTI